ncbi:hypothetical protein [Algoriphagus marinus]|uniref:hypothetical protein n=1 Tax=Algoriphagus marinus TaxID=1925762 RepID=UPI00094BA53C|nr:hypothetical protein [Algoriphagus marinus]
MSIISLSPRPSFETHPKLAKQSLSLENLLTAISRKDIPEAQASKINEIIAGINNFSGPDPELLKAMKAGQAAILKLLEKELKIVPQNHYQTLWMALGMSAIGLPLGVAFGAAIGNMAFLAIGIPIGMSIGIALGNGMDVKAKNEGRQLEWKAI